MRRGVTRSGQERILSRIRTVIPDVTVRTTFIVGFPGETDKDFEELCDFVSEQRFDRVGVFTYSQEDGTEGARMDGQIEEHVRKERQDHLMELQADISKERLSRHIGEELEVLVDGPSEDFPLVKSGRTATQAPDVDGVVYLDKAPEDLKAGMFTKVRILQASNYDMVGEVL